MERIVTYSLLAVHLLTGLFFIISVTRSKILFSKAKHRDVRELLADEVKLYEQSIRMKLVFKIFMSSILLTFSLSRIKAGCIYVSTLDMWLWVLFSIFFLGVAFHDFKASSPEK